MDAQTFLNKLRGLADSYKQLQQNSNEVFDYLDTNYEVYIDATSEEREKIRSFIAEQRYDVPKEGITFYLAYLLLLYVKERVIPNLKPARKISIFDKLKGTSESPEDIVQLLRGLVSLSMENNVEKYTDEGYGYGVSSLVLLADLYVTAEERGIKPKKYFQQIASVSSKEGVVPMNDFMATGGDSRLRAERKQFGKFKGVF